MERRWFQCTVQVHVDEEYVREVAGKTDDEVLTGADWEEAARTKIDENGGSYFGLESL